MVETLASSALSILVLVIMLGFIGLALSQLGLIGPRIWWKRVKRRLQQYHLLSKRDTPKIEVSPFFDLEQINADVSIHHVISYLRQYLEHQPHSKKDFRGVSLLFWGPPGTGKTELVKHISNALNRPLLVKEATKLIHSLVGATEKSLAQSFKEAEVTESILFLDEIDSFLQSRTKHHYSWESTQVNELLTQMEAFKGIFFASTNFLQALDQASLRRFTFKVEFNYLKETARLSTYSNYFPAEMIGPPCESSIRRLHSIPHLAFGDFKVAAQKLRFMNSISHEVVLDVLEQESKMKAHFYGKPIGIRPT